MLYKQLGVTVKIAPIVSKTALSEQKQDSLNTSVSVVAPEMQQFVHSLPFSNTFFTLLPTKGGVAGDVAQRDARAIITFGTMYRMIIKINHNCVSV